MRKRLRFGPDGKPLAAETVAIKEAVGAPALPLVRYEPPASLADTALSVAVVKRMVDLVEEIGRSVMKEGVDFGPPYPGSNKKMLYQSGAQILDVAFRLNPTFEILELVRGEGHLEALVRCSMVHIPTGAVFATAIASATTLEKGFQETMAKSKIGPYELQNSLLKRAQKRAHVSATLNATAASRIYSPDLEELEEVAGAAPAPAPPATDGKGKMETGSPTPTANVAPAPTPVATDAVAKISTGQHASIIERLARLGQSPASEPFREWLETNYNTGKLSELTIAQAEQVIEILGKRLAKVLEEQAKKVAGDMGVKTVGGTMTVTTTTTEGKVPA